MVRRRSTVRFRKGAPRSGVFFDTDPVTSYGGIPGEGTGQRLGWKPGLWRGGGLRVVGDSDRVGGGVPWGALWGARSFLSGLKRRGRSGGRPHLASYFA